MRKLGIRRPERSDLNALNILQTVHLLHIPYENLDSLSHRLTSLEHEDLFRKMILGHWGGICFEINGLYAWLLESLGYDIRNHAARFIYDNDRYQMRRHRVMTVTIDGRRYLTDVGVNSESARQPLLLQEDLVQSDGISEYCLKRDEFWGWLLWHRLTGHEWKPLYGFTEEPQLDLDYIMPCIFCDLHPQSPINKFEKISIFREDSNVRIWNGYYQEFRNGVREVNRPLDAEEKTEILRTVFGIRYEAEG